MATSETAKTRSTGWWSLLMLAGAVWLAVGWSVLRLDPADVGGAAAPVLFFATSCELVRALAMMRTWWLNAGLAALFALTGVIALVSPDAPPVALVAWFLMVRGAMDVAVSVMNRGTDRTWGLMMSLGVVQVGLGYFAASVYAHTSGAAVLVLGGVGLLRGVADLTVSLRLREVATTEHEVISPERAAAYAAGLADYPAAATATVSAKAIPEPEAEHATARHRAATRP